MPTVKIDMVIKLVLTCCPLVKGLVHYEHSVLVAEIEELRCRWVVCCADRITTSALEDFDAAFPDSFRYCCSHSSTIVVKVYTLHLDLLAVEKEAFVNIIFYCADTKAALNLVLFFSGYDYLRTQSVEVRIFCIPKLCVSYAKLLIEFELISCNERNHAVRACHLVAFLVNDSLTDDGVELRLCLIDYLRLYLYCCSTLNKRLCVVEYAPFLEMSFVSGNKTHVAVDTRTCVPS